MRQIDQGLHYTFIGRSLNLIQEQRENNRNREIKNQIVQRQHDRIGEQKPKTIDGASIKHALKVIETYPGTAADSQRREVILKDNNQVTGRIQFENDIKDCSRNQHDIQPFIPFQRLPEPLFFSHIYGNCFCHITTPSSYEIQGAACAPCLAFTLSHSSPGFHPESPVRRKTAKCPPQPGRQPRR